MVFCHEWDLLLQFAELRLRSCNLSWAFVPYTNVRKENVRKASSVSDYKPEMSLDEHIVLIRNNACLETRLALPLKHGFSRLAANYS